MIENKKGWVWKESGGRGKCLGKGFENAWKVRGYWVCGRGYGYVSVESSGGGVGQQGLGRITTFGRDRVFSCSKTVFLVAFHAARPQHPVQST